MKKLKLPLVALALLALTACAGLTRSTYNTQKLAADTAVGAVHGYNLYLATATNQVTGTNLVKLLNQRDQVYAAAKKFGQVEQAVTVARVAYAADSADTNKTTLTVVLSSLNASSDAIVALVKSFMTPGGN